MWAINKIMIMNDDWDTVLAHDVISNATKMENPPGAEVLLGTVCGSLTLFPTCMSTGLHVTGLIWICGAAKFVNSDELGFVKLLSSGSVRVAARRGGSELLSEMDCPSSGCWPQDSVWFMSEGGNVLEGARSKWGFGLKAMMCIRQIITNLHP